MAAGVRVSVWRDPAGGWHNIGSRLIRMSSRLTPEQLRPYRWFGPNDLRSFGHRSRARQMGLGPADWEGKPVIAILNTWSELKPCHLHFKILRLNEAIKRHSRRLLAERRGIRRRAPCRPTSVVSPPEAPPGRREFSHSLGRRRTKKKRRPAWSGTAFGRLPLEFLRTPIKGVSLTSSGLSRSFAGCGRRSCRGRLASLAGGLPNSRGSHRG